jgi:hypothetical protein
VDRSDNGVNCVFHRVTLFRAGGFNSRDPHKVSESYLRELSLSIHGIVYFDGEKLVALLYPETK